MPQTMQAIHVSEDHDMHLAGLERPEPGPGEVLLRVRAAGVNRADVLQRAGRYPPPPGAPATMGLECAGEVVALGEGRIGAGSGSTELFIHPPFDFRVVDGLLTNFHLPRSTLLMLVAAFAGYERTMKAYAEAVREGYRFYSYGDAMAIPPAGT